MGPILSFRGYVEDSKQWKVSALIVIAPKDKPPVLQLEGKPGAPPVELLSTGGMRVLRYDLSVTLLQGERRVAYGFGQAPGWEFTVPSDRVAPRVAYASCNGFSDPKAVKKLAAPFNSVWRDLLSNHDKKLRDKDYKPDKEQRWHEERVHSKGLQRFHLLAMGGDQIYFDSILYARDKVPELCEWSEWASIAQESYDPTADLKERISDYYLNLYTERWQVGNVPAGEGGSPKNYEAATVMASVPTIMMWDDHDIIDGWGSYPPALQYCPILQHMFHAARRAFWIFQLQHRDADLPALQDTAWDGKAAADAPAFKPVNWQGKLAADPLALPFLPNQPGFSYAFNIGAISIIVPDLRTERSQTQILSETTWESLIKAFDAAGSAEHVMVMSSVPVAYPKLGAADRLAVLTTFSFKGNMADDLNDHWSHRSHEGERKRLIRAMISAASSRKVRFTLLSGDVHIAAWGTIYRKDGASSANWLRINQLTSSSIVHPPPSGFMENLFLDYVNQAAKSTQPVDTEHVVEMMLFPESDAYVQASRNWLAMELDDAPFAKTGRRRLWATWRCEHQTDAQGNVSFSNHLLAIHPVREGD
jgi:hypothetical protein